MRLFSIASGAAGLMLALGAAPASSQSQASGQPTAQKDPNRVICQRVEEIGSRLASKRICMTAQQWDEQRRQDRMAVQNLQQRENVPSSK